VTVALTVILVEMVLAAFGRASIAVLTVASGMLVSPAALKSGDRWRAEANGDAKPTPKAGGDA
jgi:hypothetical protein